MRTHIHVHEHIHTILIVSTHTYTSTCTHIQAHMEGEHAIPFTSACPYMCTHTITCMHQKITFTCNNTHMHMPTHAHTQSPAYMHNQICISMHTPMHAQAWANTHMHASHKQTHACTYAHIKAYLRMGVDIKKCLHRVT